MGHPVPTGHDQPERETVLRRQRLSIDRELTGGGVDERDVEVDQQVVEADRGDRIAQGFEGHGVVSAGELKLVRSDLRARNQGARGQRLDGLPQRSISIRIHTIYRPITASSPPAQKMEE